jgi:cytochrome b561
MVKIPNHDAMKIAALRSHMTGGALILLLMLARLLVRARTAHPGPASTGNPALDRLAWASHRLLYLAVLAMAGSGLLLALQTGLLAIVFGDDGALPADFWVFPARTAHYLLSRLLMGLIALHVAGAFYHALILRDGLLRRMLFGRRVLPAAGAARPPNQPLPDGAPHSRARASGLRLDPADREKNMTTFARVTPWLNRLVLVAATLVLALIGFKFISDPVGAATASNISLESALAVTNMRASFGAFPLGCAMIAFACLVSAHRHLAGLSFVATIIGVALAVRIFGVVTDGTLNESLRVLSAESVLLLLSVLGILAELSVRRHREAASPREASAG